MRSVSVFGYTKSVKNLRFNSHFSLTKSLDLFAVVLLITASYSTSSFAADVKAVACIIEQPSYTQPTVNCTAGDLGLSSPIVNVTKSCNYPGDIAELNVRVSITTTAQTRYDMGLWFSVDGDPNGDGSATGLCRVVSLPINITDMDGNSTDIDGDACGDVASTDTGPPDIPLTDLGSFLLPCNDTDGDGLLDVPLIVAYSNQSDPANCSASIQATPQTKSKCSENLQTNFPVPIPGRIIVIKNTIPDNALEFDFTLTGPELAPIPAGGFDSPHAFMLADGGKFDTAALTGGLTPGVFDLQEVPDANYVSVMVCISDVDGPIADPRAMDLSAGETIICKVTNTLNGAVAIVKNTIGAPLAINDPVETFDFTFAQGADFTLTPLATDTTGNGTDNVSNLGLAPGTYTFTEEPEAGWELTNLSCVGGDTSVVGSTVTINLVGSETVTCTFQNTERGQIEILKTTDPVSANTFSFTHYYDVADPDATVPAVSFDLDAGSMAFFVDALPGTVMVTEVDPTPGYELFSIECIDGNPSGTTSTSSVGTRTATIEVDPGETVACEFVNNQLAQLTLQKEWVDGVAGDTAGLVADGANGPIGNTSTAMGGVGSEIDTNTAVLTAVVGETVSLVEVLGLSNVGDYTTSFACNGTNDPTYTPGERSATLLIDTADSAITCTYTNSIQLTQLQLAKTWSGAVSGDAITAATTGLTNNASLVSSTTGDDTDTGTPVQVFSGETATLGAETFTTGDAANYITSDWVCDDADGSTVAASGTLDITDADLGKTITCTVTNTIVNTQIQLAKTWSGAIVDDAISAATTGLTNNASVASTSTGDNTDTGTAAQVFVGETATLPAEMFTTGDAANYITSDWVCDDAAGSTVAAGGTLDILAGDAGKTITCTVTNTMVTTPDRTDMGPMLIPVAVPVDNKFALLLLTLMMLATGWYFKLAVVRKR